MSNYVRYTGESGTHRGPSPIIFGDLSKIYHDQLMGKCILIYDDFATTTEHATVSASGGYYTYQDTGATIRGVNTAPDLSSTGALGVLEIVKDTTDNDEAHVQFSGYQNPFRIDNASGNTGACGFECRIQTNTVADNGLAFFLGFAQGPVAADYLIDDTGALHASRGFVGFQRLNDDGDKIDITYKESGQTQQAVETNAHTMVVNTWTKFGFIYRPSAVSANKITFYIDGVDSGSYVTTTNLDNAQFPEGTALAPVILTKGGDTTSYKLLVDYVAAFQYVDGQEP